MSETPTPTEAPAQTPTQPESFSREYVESLRDEAAKYRNEKKSAVEQAEVEARNEVVKEYEPQLAEKDTEIAALKDTVAQQGTELLKLRAVIKAKVPTEDIDTVAELVQGEDEESVSESVKRVMSIYGKKQSNSPAYDPSQGSGGNTMPLNGDPVLNALKAAVGAK